MVLSLDYLIWAILIAKSVLIIAFFCDLPPLALISFSVLPAIAYAFAPVLIGIPFQIAPGPRNL